MRKPRTEPPAELVDKHPELVEAIRLLYRDELETLDDWVQELIWALELEDKPEGVKKPDGRQRGRVTYQQEGVKCGKPGCRCADGELHGPYWYAYTWEQGRLRKRYIGKKLWSDGPAGAKKGGSSSRSSSQKKR